MDVLLENLTDAQVAAVKQVATQLNVDAPIYVRTEANEDFALMQAMREAQPGDILSADEKAAFRRQLRQS